MKVERAVRKPCPRSPSRASPSLNGEPAQRSKINEMAGTESGTQAARIGTRVRLVPM